MINGDKVIQLFSEGSALLQVGKAHEALICFQNAIDIDWSNATLHLYSGAALHDLGRYDEAVACYRKAVGLAPGMGEIHNNLGNSLMALGLFAEAVDCYFQAASILTASPVPLAACATALQAMGKIAEAETVCRRAVRLDPAFAAGHWNLALNLLLQGRYEEGWQEYEWRWRKPDFTSPSRHTDIPLWDGSPLYGKTILLHAEQGFGDAIQFIRYAPLVVGRGGTVLIECHPQLVLLFQSLPDVHYVIPFGAPFPPLSCQSPLLSLPFIFGTTLQTIPSATPYLFATAERRLKWSALMPVYPVKMRVGLVWAGKKYPDPLRSCRLAELAPLLSVDNVTFFSLQLGEDACASFGNNMVDLTGHIDDFADTAALIEQLDLVITIDTAVAHLTGAMGKQLYLMIPFAPDWRWLPEGNDSAWYPNARIFRQKKPGDWSDVITRVKSALETF